MNLKINRMANDNTMPKTFTATAGTSRKRLPMLLQKSGAAARFIWNESLANCFGTQGFAAAAEAAIKIKAVIAALKRCATQNPKPNRNASGAGSRYGSKAFAARVELVPFPKPALFPSTGARNLGLAEFPKPVAAAYRM